MHPDAGALIDGYWVTELLPVISCLAEIFPESCDKPPSVWLRFLNKMIFIPVLK
jgi:hypothetical protein